MTKTVVIHQPDFLPYIGFFHRLLAADDLVLLDNVQFQSRGKMAWQNRDKIKTQSGEKWLTIPVKPCRVETMINEVMISDREDWVTNNLNQLKGNYKRSEYFNEIFPYVTELYADAPKDLLSFNIKGLRLIMRLLSINVNIHLSSSLNSKGKGNERLISILKSINATHYLSGQGARDYLKPELFKQKGIEVIWHEFKHPVYPQQFGEFVPCLSILDMLFNCGIEKSNQVIRSIAS